MQEDRGKLALPTGKDLTIHQSYSAFFYVPSALFFYCKMYCKLILFIFVLALNYIHIICKAK